MVLEVNVQVRHRVIQVLLIFQKGDFVAKLKSTVVVWSLLDCVIGEMDELVEVLQVELLPWGPQIPIIIGERHQIAIDRSDQSEASYIKLPVFEESWIFDVFLYDKRPSVPRFWINVWFDFFQFSLHGDADASVGIFTWFQDPYILLILGRLAWLQLCFGFIQQILKFCLLWWISFLLHNIILFLYVHFP